MHKRTYADSERFWGRFQSASRTFRFTTIALVLLAGIGSTGFAAEYYVDPVAGSDTANGLDRSTAWRTVGHAEAQVSAGSTIYLMDGNYGTITIDSTKTRANWDQAVTITPDAGASPSIHMLRVRQGIDRYLIFDGLTVKHPDTLRQANGDVTFLIESRYVRLNRCTVFGFLGVGSRYPDDDRYTQETTTDAAVQILGSHVTLDECTVGCSLFAVDIATDVVDCAVVVRNCNLGFTPGQCIQIGGPARSADAILIENNIIQHKVYSTSANYTSYVHGTGILLWTDGATIRNNIIRGYGDDGSIRGAVHAADGGYEFEGVYSDAAHKFTIGDSVTQGSTHGVYTGTRGSVPYYVFTPSKEDTPFVVGVPIVHDSDPQTALTPTVLRRTTRWGGLHQVKIYNNLIHNPNVGGGGIHIYEAGPGLEIINNTIIGPHNGRTGPTYFESAARIGLPPYFNDDLSSMKICNNIFVGLVNLCEYYGEPRPGIFPPGCTAVGNVIWCANDNTGGGAKTYTTQAEMNAAFPGNKVYNWTIDNDDVGIFQTAGNTFVGGPGFDDNGFGSLSLIDNWPVEGYGTVNDVYAVALGVSDMGHAYDLAPDSFPIGFADKSTARATDLWGTLRDGSPDSGCDEFTSSEGNNAPRLNPIGDKSIAPDSALSFQVSATDAENDALTFSASGLPTGATFVNQTFTWTPTEAQVGTHQVTFIVSDGQAQDSETITIVVTSGNLPPVLAAIGNKSAREGEPLTFSISATDPEGDTISYSATGLPTGASLAGRDFSWTPGYDQADTHEVTFIANDGQFQDSETITITVANVNRPPTLSSVPDQDVDQDSLLAFDLAATDPDGDTLTYSASGLPAGASFSGSNFTWTPTSSQIGVYDVSFVVSDGQFEDVETATFTVVSTSPDSTPPTVAMISPEPDDIQVALNHLVKLHVTDAGRGVDPETVTIRVSDQVIYQGDTDLHTSGLGRCSRTGNRYDYRYIFQAAESFKPDRTATVQVSASDYDGNAMPTYTYAFLTEMRAFGSNLAVSSAATGPSDEPAVATDPAGNIWTVWRAGNPGDTNIYVARLAAGEQTFGASVALTADAGDRGSPDIAIAPDGRLYVVWQSFANGNWNIVLSTSSNGTDWSRPTSITDSDGNETYPAVAVDRQSPQRVYVTWQDDRDGNADIYVASSTTAFSDSSVVRVTTNASDQMEPDIAAGLDDITLVWTDTRAGNPDIYGASNGDNWANTPVVSKPGNQSEPAIAVAPGSSTLHIVWTDETPGNRDVYYASSNGLPASPLDGVSIIDDTAGADQMTPTIASADDLNIFACWQDQRHAGTNGDSDLFMVDLGVGSIRTNVFVGDGGTNSSQNEPAAGIDAYGNPYFVWTDGRDAQAGVFYAASTFIDPAPLDSQVILAAAGGTIGTDADAIDSKDDVSIVIPAGACQFDARVTIAEIVNPLITPVACLGSYDFGPSGIDFDAPVTVTIPYVFAAAGGSATPYWYDSLTGAMSQQGITDVENLVISPTLNALRFRTTHFTPFYLVAGDAEVPIVEEDTAAGGCSISPGGGGSARDMILPYALLALVMIALKRADRRKRQSLPQ